MQSVKKNFEVDPSLKWRDLGPFGEGRLIDIQASVGNLHLSMFQLITVKNKMAYVLTLSAQKEEFLNYCESFKTVLHSLTVTDDLFKGKFSVEKKKLSILL